MDYHLEDEEMGAAHSLDTKHTIIKHLMTALLRWLGVAAGIQRRMRSFHCVHPENELVIPEGIGQLCFPNASHVP